MKRLILMVISIFCLFASGCTGRSRPPEPPRCRVVTEITVQAENGAQIDQWRFSESRAMSKLLNYLRHRELWDEVEPDPSAEPCYRITLYLSDGTQKTYDQLGISCLRTEDGPWMRIPEDKGIRLKLLLSAVQ